ncbi:hypothetical protein LEMLEM_LOCUS19983, partial [Lemmus lemmus]
KAKGEIAGCVFSQSLQHSRPVVFGFTLGPWSPKECQVRFPSHGVGLQPNPILVDHSHKLVPS